MKKITYISIILFLIFSFPMLGWSQSTVSLDSLGFYIRNVQDNNDLLPLTTTDSAYVAPKVEVSIQFKISNLSNLSSVDIIFEKDKGQNNFKIFHLDYAVKNGKPYLIIGKTFFPVVNSKVIITREVPADLLNKKIYFSIKALDQNQNQSNVLTRDFN